METYKAILLLQNAGIRRHALVQTIFASVLLTHPLHYNRYLLILDSAVISNLIANRRDIFGKLQRGNVFYLGRNVSDMADVASAQLSSRRGRQDVRIHKYCSQSTLPVENNSCN